MKSSLFLGAILGISLTVTLGFCARPQDEKMMSEHINSIEDVKQLLPKSPEQIERDSKKFMGDAQKAVDAIIAIPKEKRTFQNSAKELDDLFSRSNFSIHENFVAVTKYLHPDKDMRDMAQKMMQEMEQFMVGLVTTNKELYRAFAEYANGNALQENLTDEQRYFIAEIMNDFKRAGLDLPEEKLAQVKKIKEELTELSLQFDSNIADDNRTITVTKDGLAGLDQDFIDSLERTESGDYILGIDYPTYYRVIEHSDVEDTRRRLFEAFANRGLPANKEILTKIVALRDQLAKLIGYESYAALNIDKQMAGTPERVQQFLTDLRARAAAKADTEFAEFIKYLPGSIQLRPDGKLNSWDMSRLKAEYKKKNFAIDERKIAEYFPMQQTIDALLDIYRQFMSVEFEEVPVTGTWHEDVRLVKVYNKDKSQLYGYLFLDLHPRPNKYSHAAHAGLIPAVKLPDGSRLPTVSVVMANFPKATKDKPSLLMRSDVSTFFHEFGHAIHSLLGATQMGSFAGTRVKTDFVEMPSQMLEEWLWDPAILKKVSSHYKTGEALPDETIQNILALKRYDSGTFVTRQAFLAQYALDLFKAGAQKDPEALWFSLVNSLLPSSYAGPEYRAYASFGHLTGYGAKYYGYLWSKVFALDLFDAIKKVGLLNPEIGTKYVSKVIGKGGSEHPDALLKDFLGRAPSQDAFLRDMGLVG